MISRRSFLRILGLGALAGPTLVRAALKPDVIVGWDLSGGPDGTVLTIAKLQEAKRLMDANEIPESFFRDRFRQIMSETRHPLASGEVQDFMGFTFIRTPLVEPPITAAQIRAAKARGMTLDQRINNRYRQPWTWEMDKLLIGVEVDETYLQRVRRQIREAFYRPWS